ncbi:MAG: hypothetical protein DQL93_0045 (endogenous virus) [Lactobacillus phage ViSo-2018b]|nr:MAG: hypothetical protein DQL93_0045 [Lactobacillus phage ViSo-2018b]
MSLIANIENTRLSEELSFASQTGGGEGSRNCKTAKKKSLKCATIVLEHL